MYLDKIKTFFKKLNYKSFILIVLLLFGITPIIQRAVSAYLTTYSYMLLVVAVVLFTIIACRIAHIREFVLFLLPFILYQVIVLLYNRSDDILLAGYQALLFMLPVLVGYYLVTHNFFAGLYTCVIVIAVVITGITTIIGCVNYPEAARTLATTKTSQDPLAVLYEWNNIGGYRFVYSTVLLFPFVILAFKLKKLHIVPTILFTVLAFTIAITTEYTYAFVLLMMSTAMLFIPRGIAVKKFILLIFVCVLAVLLFRTTIGAIINNVGEYVGESTIIDKLKVLFLGKEAVAGFSDDRDELYRLSFNTFLRNPLFGNLFSESQKTGGHSFILDNLANYGLLGAGLMVFMYRGIYRVFIRPLKNQTGYCLLLWTLFQPIFLSTINTAMWLDNLCLYTPIILCAIYGQEIYRNRADESPTPLIRVNVLQSKVKSE